MRGVTHEGPARPLDLLRVAALALLILAAYSLKLFEPLPLDAAASSSRLVLDRDGHLLRAFTTPDGRWRLDAKPEEVSADLSFAAHGLRGPALLEPSRRGPAGDWPGGAANRPLCAARFRRLDAHHAGRAPVARLADALDPR